MKHSIRVLSCVCLFVCITYIWYITNQHAPPVDQPRCIWSVSLFNQTVIDNNSSEECHWKFDHYVASGWERFWYDNIDALQKNVCVTLSKADQMSKSIRLIERITILQQSIFNKSSISKEANELFSQMFYRLECSSGRSLLVAQQIEPLVGLLRDPLTICSGFNQTIPLHLIQNEEDDMQSKRFILLAPSAPYVNFPPTGSQPPWISQKHRRKYLFDIGSSYFNGNSALNKRGSATSARWFYEYFRKNSLQFDRIIAFEDSELLPKTAWQQLPDDLVTVYTLINVAVETSGKFNPLKMLQSLAQPEDYVLFKLDIDAFYLEMKFIEQIIENKLLHSLIDELFFEMHVSVNEMLPYWELTVGPVHLNDSYVLFTKLRQLGIRMHSWP
ncbi:unnamed protein product [Adineta steineri]|uniref:Uncharacterized protein n=1 Tax=Adineta steineri TaxID=433720 RepID=A0A819QZJ2_9BILA|nr:unnamed protein product [Adineta steineri]CAF4039809.1 unnamed protein product [Adineta steineri]